MVELHNAYGETFETNLQPGENNNNNNNNKIQNTKTAFTTVNKQKNRQTNKQTNKQRKALDTTPKAF